MGAKKLKKKIKKYKRKIKKLKYKIFVENNKKYVSAINFLDKREAGDALSDILTTASKYPNW